MKAWARTLEWKNTLHGSVAIVNGVTSRLGGSYN